MNSAAMIDRCFRRQHPEAYDGLAISEPEVPAQLRYGRDRLPPSQARLAEEPMGYPNASRFED